MDVTREKNMFSFMFIRILLGTKREKGPVSFLILTQRVALIMQTRTNARKYTTSIILGVIHGCYPCVKHTRG